MLLGLYKDYYTVLNIENQLYLGGDGVINITDLDKKVTQLTSDGDNLQHGALTNYFLSTSMPIMWYMEYCTDFGVAMNL